MVSCDILCNSVGDIRKKIPGEGQGRQNLLRIDPRDERAAWGFLAKSLVIKNPDPECPAQGRGCFWGQLGAVPKKPGLYQVACWADVQT